MRILILAVAGLIAVIGIAVANGVIDSHWSYRQVAINDRGVANVSMYTEPPYDLTAHYEEGQLTFRRGERLIADVSVTKIDKDHSLMIDRENRIWVDQSLAETPDYTVITIAELKPGQTASIQEEIAVAEDRFTGFYEALPGNNFTRITVWFLLLMFASYVVWRVVIRRGGTRGIIAFSVVFTLFMAMAASHLFVDWRDPISSWFMAYAVVMPGLFTLALLVSLTAKKQTTGQSTPGSGRSEVELLAKNT